MITVGLDGKFREMFCLPWHQVHDWLNTINANRVKAEIRPKVLRYQKECQHTTITRILQATYSENEYLKRL